MKPNATERKVFIGCGVIGALLLALPGGLTPSLIAASATLMVYIWHRRQLRIEANSAQSLAHPAA